MPDDFIETPLDVLFAPYGGRDLQPFVRAHDMPNDATPPTVHDLKCWPIHFESIRRREKRADVRKADRPYAVGDHLHLQEWTPGDGGGFTGRDLTVRVTHILTSTDFPAILPGHAVLSIAHVAK